MSNIQRATILMLGIAVFAIWSLGLRAALRGGERTDQKVALSPAIVDTPARVTPTLTLGLASGETPSLEPISTTPTRTITPTPSRTMTPSPTATPTASATPTRRPSPTPTPTATIILQPTPTWTSPPTGTPVIPGAGRFLLVNQDEQIMHVYEDGVEMRTISVSTGRPIENAFTPAWRGDVGRYWGGGPFLDTNLYSDHMWYLFPGARGSILIHSTPYTWDGDLKIYDQPDALGVEPTSHGCVRISPEDARWLENWDPVGAPIEITPWSGEIGPPDESL